VYGVRCSPDDNQYAKPVDILPLVDLNTRKVIRIDKHSVPPAIPSEDNNYHCKSVEGSMCEPQHMLPCAGISHMAAAVGISF